MAQPSVPDQVAALPPAKLAKLFSQACLAAQKAHAPYSNFTVGAALLLASGEVITGCNIENASYSITLCAERVAASIAIASQKRDWQAIVVVSPTGVSPCGACRQFMAEFAPRLPIYFGRIDQSANELTQTDLAVLLPAQMTLLKN